MADLDYNLASDKTGRAVQMVKLGTTTVTATIGASSAGGALPTGATSVRVASNGNVHIKFGAGAQTASTSDPLFPAGVEHFRLADTDTHFAVIRDTSASSGTVTVTRVDA